MPAPRFTSVDPAELDRIVDVLRQSPESILQMTGLDQPRADWDLADLENWRIALGQAQERIKEKGPDRSDYVLTGIGGTTTVIGLALLAPPIGVPALIATGVAVVGAGGTLWSVKILIGKDNRMVDDHERVEDAKRLIEERLRSHNRTA